MNELNPNHPVTVAVHDQWHKFCAILLHHFGQAQFEITTQLIDDFKADFPEGGIVCDARNDRIILRLVTEMEAAKLADNNPGSQGQTP